MSRSRTGLVFCLAALVAFATPLLVVGAVTPVDPEIRLIRTTGSVSALIVTERERVLIINSDNRGVTRSAIGRFARPWEPTITTLLAPANDTAVVGLWEALRDPRIQQVIIVGLPGSDPLWCRIERECAQRGVDLEYVNARSYVALTNAGLVIDPAGMTVSVRHHTAVVAIALTSELLTLGANIAVVNDIAAAPQDADLIVAPSYPETDVMTPVVMVGDRELVHLVLQANTIKVQGGRPRMTNSETN
jgi:hypothetical protein